jgi:RNA polymerase sigma-70 factor, ECF subfamily
MSAIAMQRPATNGFTKRTAAGRSAGSRGHQGAGVERLDGTAAASSEWAGERALVAALQHGDEAVFAQLVDQYHGQLLRLARSYVRDRQVAEEVVQDTWIGVIRGIGRFEGRSSLRTWLFRILANTAKSRGVQEHRSVPFSALAAADADDGSVEADRFVPEGHVWAGHWAAAPGSWGTGPMERLLAKEAQQRIDTAISELPDVQRRVITLRDVEGWSSDEVCDALQISEGNQRVLLHRARTKVRAMVDAYLSETDA